MKFVQGLVGKSVCSHLALEVFEPFLVDQQAGMSGSGKLRIVEGDIKIGHRVIRLFIETFRNVSGRGVAVPVTGLSTCSLLRSLSVRIRDVHFGTSSVTHSHAQCRHK